MGLVGLAGRWDRQGSPRSRRASPLAAAGPSSDRGEAESTTSGTMRRSGGRRVAAGSAPAP